ncbi:hypothetical protein C7W93_09915 [Glaciimonas sp. PCH181]|nr:hypothetical protein C7W93_09915 [Glaciimonas sp. PCH181]
MISVAISARVAPSASLFAMVTLQAIAVASIGMLLIVGEIGHFVPVIGVVLGLVSVLISVWGWLGYRRTRRPIRIVITGNGQISIAELATNTVVGADAAFHAPVIAHLLSGSTLWAHLLLLRFQLGNGRIKSVVILPDCIPEDVFRALSVACRWIASRGRSEGSEKVVYEQPIG